MKLTKKYFSFVGLIVIAGVLWNWPSKGRFLAGQPAKLELHHEYPEANEAEEFRRLSQVINQIQERLSPGKPLRGFHVKSVGCLRGTLEVNPSRPADARFGLFKDEERYAIWARFSNASASMQGDDESDLRGLAVKVMGVKGPQILPAFQDQQVQDFLMTNAPVHFAKNPTEMMEFAEASSYGRFSTLKYFATHPMQAKRIVGDTRRKVQSLAQEQYWSRAPSMLGSKAIKYSTRPCVTESIEGGVRSSPRYLTEDLIERANREELCFDFLVQFQADPYLNPIEDASVEWRESDAPFVKVGTIRLAKQRFDSPEQMQFCDELDFNPWHSLAEHRPIGSMNRARLLVYGASQDLRHGR